MRYQLLTGLLMATILLSCRKDEAARPACIGHCITVSGQVTDAPGGIPIGNATVRLSTVAGVYSSELGHAQTDADGRYSITFPFSFSGYHPGVLLQASHASFLSNEIGNDWIRTVNDNSDTSLQFIENIHLYRKAELDIHVTSAGYGTGVLVPMTRKFGAPGPAHMLSTVPMIDLSGPVDTTYTMQTAGDVLTTLSFSWDSNGRRDTITVPAGARRLIHVNL